MHRLPRRPGTLAGLAAAAALAAACSGAPTGSVEPGGPSFLAAPPSGTGSSPVTPQDSVYSGYGNEATGGLEYEHFEYDPATGTEYVATPDTTPEQP